MSSSRMWRRCVRLWEWEEEELIGLLQEGSFDEAVKGVDGVAHTGPLLELSWQEGGSSG